MGKKPDPTITIETTRTELTTGATFAGRYQIIEELGRGGMGRVYKVHDQETGERMALKLIKPEIAADPDTIERFRNELTTARRITHKSVCRMYDLNREEDLYYITMEYVSGGDLKRLIRRTKQLPIGTAVAIAIQICEGLAEAHRLGTIHRDLKPNNIIIDDDGQARIMDFGIARTVATKGITGPGVMIGTPEYMSPEQVEGRDVDQRSDVYSLGIILYEMLTGAVPFEGDTPFTVGVKHKSETPPDPAAINPQISEDLSRLILKCLEKSPDNRFQSAGELRSALEEISQGLPTSQKTLSPGAPISSSKTPPRKPLTSREITVTIGVKKLLLPALILIGIVAAAVILWRFILYPGGKSEAAGPIPTDKPSLAVLYFENNSGDPGHDNWRSALSEMLITDLSQSRYLHVLSGDRIYSLLKRLDLLDRAKYASEDLERVADQTSVSHILRGSFITAGEKFIINTSLVKMDTNEVVTSLREEGIGEASITDSLDKITTQMKSALELSPEQISSDLDRELSQITTDSPEALKYYAEGIELHNQGKDRESLALYQRAIKADPEFAMAYAKLGTVYGNLGLTRQGHEYLERALELKHRLSEKELLYVQGAYFYDSEGTYDKALEAHRKTLDIYHADTTASHNTGLIYYMLEEWDKAIPFYENAVNNGTEFLGSYEQLANCYLYLGEYDQARDLLQGYLRNRGDAAPIHWSLIKYFLAVGDHDSALTEAETAYSMEPNDFWNLGALAMVYRFRGELAKAEDTYWKLMQMTEPGAGYVAANGACSLYTLWGKYAEAESVLETGIADALKLGIKWAESEWHTKLAWILSRDSRHEQALKECDAALEAAKQAARYSMRFQREALHAKGLVQVAAGAAEEARSTAEDLRQLIESGMHKKAIRYYGHLMGIIEADRGNLEEALRLFEGEINQPLMGIELQPTGTSLQQERSWFLFSWASVLYASGRLDQAREKYENIVTQTPGGVFYGWHYTESLYMLGRIHERLGNPSEAREFYNRAKELWKDADPEVKEEFQVHPMSTSTIYP